jgi:hypothetical protein
LAVVTVDTLTAAVFLLSKARQAARAAAVQLLILTDKGRAARALQGKVTQAVPVTLRLQVLAATAAAAAQARQVEVGMTIMAVTAV